jgi:hypothetical protein
LQLIHRYRLPAIFCALAVLLCELISRPYAEMGIADEGPYVLTAKKVAQTGHIVYNGWVSAMLGWQLYLGAAFIKLFGFSFTTVRMSTLLVAMVLAFVLQRCLVRAGISERNATIGTLALVLSPLYLSLSVTFMSDIGGLFALTFCLYACIVALQSSTSRGTIGWLAAAVIVNVVCGSSRQIAWLGVLVIVPSALWLLRRQRRILIIGIAMDIAGTLAIAACLAWFSRQPYTIPAHLLIATFPIGKTLLAFTYFLLDIPFLLLPLTAIYIPSIRKSSPRVLAIFLLALLMYLFLALYRSHVQRLYPLQPTAPDHFGFNVHGAFDYTFIKGQQPILFGKAIQVFLTLISFFGLYGFVVSFFGPQDPPPAEISSSTLSWKQLGVLFGPFTIVYIVLLASRAATFGLFERYELPLLVLVVLCLTRHYQERIEARLPSASILLIAIMAFCGILINHNTYSLYRARVAIAEELQSNGIPMTAVDNGWEFNLNVELQNAVAVNDPDIILPPHFFVPTPPQPHGVCPMHYYDETPHIHPLYGISFDPNACYGPAPFAPVHYSRWPFLPPGTLYVVHYVNASQP